MALFLLRFSQLRVIKPITKIIRSICCSKWTKDVLHGIAELSINEDEQPEFEKFAKEMMSNKVRRSEPGTRNYEWFLAEGGSKCVIIETYDSSNTGLVHLRGEAINKIFPEILKIAKNSTRFEICGKPSEVIVREIADDNLSIYRFINGFPC